MTLTAYLSRESVDLRTILLVEDEQKEVQNEMQRLLENLGYNVLVKILSPVGLELAISRRAIKTRLE